MTMEDLLFSERQEAFSSLTKDDQQSDLSSFDTYSDAIREECAALVRSADNVEAANRALPRIRSILGRFPLEVDANLSYALVAEMTRVREGMLELWTDISAKFPDSFKALQFRLRWLSRHRQADEGLALLEERYPGVPNDEALRLEKAELLLELREVAGSKNLFLSTLADFPNSTNALILYGKRLREWGELTEALKVFKQALANGDAPKSAAAVADELSCGIAVLDRSEPGWRANDTPSRIMVLKVAIDAYRCRELAVPAPDRLGSVSLITGSLGTGGAERQLARTAACLERAKRCNVKVAGCSIAGPIQVVVKSLSPENNHDFFLPIVAAENGECYQIDNMPRARSSDLVSDDSDLRYLLPLIPSDAAYGVLRLVEHFRSNRTEVAYIWQDGAVLFAALAALIAGVPRIILNARGLPPSLRPHLYRAEYQPMYRALANIPGVEFMSNCQAVANAYCEWLDLPVERFYVVHNGVEQLPPDAGETDVERWEKFERHTSDATETIGGVFRIDVDKRPELWIDFAHDYYMRHPNARFVLVGNGPLMHAVRQRAADLGIADRVLFVGRSPTVGYWLTKMDAFVLLSRFEGLPNALVEAQLAGLPVVSTPTGGAAETFLPGVTGLATETVEDVDLAALSAKVSQLLEWRSRDPELPQKIYKVGVERFSMASMVENTVKVLTNPSRHIAGNHQPPPSCPRCPSFRPGGIKQYGL